KETDGRQLPSLLRAHRERPRGGAAKQRDELAAAAHSITLSARAIYAGTSDIIPLESAIRYWLSQSSISSARSIRESGTSMPSAFAVVRLITNSNLVDW